MRSLPNSKPKKTNCFITKINLNLVIKIFLTSSNAKPQYTGLLGFGRVDKNFKTMKSLSKPKDMHWLSNLTWEIWWILIQILRQHLLNFNKFSSFKISSKMPWEFLEWLKYADFLQLKHYKMSIFSLSNKNCQSKKKKRKKLFLQGKAEEQSSVSTLPNQPTSWKSEMTFKKLSSLLPKKA